jgi:HSP20 family protein
MSNFPIDVKKTSGVREGRPDVWQSFRNEMDRLFDRFDFGMRLPSARQLFEAAPLGGYKTGFDFNVPAADVSEDEKTYKITAELPGMDEKNIEVSLSGRQLSLKGEKKQEREEKSKNYYLSERSFGSYQRSFQLPDGVDEDKITAMFENGVLTVTLPKTLEAQKQQKKIEIKAA